MWITNIFSKYSKEHQKLLKLAYDIIKFVETDHKREQLEKKIEAIGTIEEAKIIETRKPLPDGIWNLFDDDGHYIGHRDSSVEGFWDNHKVRPNGTVVLKESREDIYRYKIDTNANDLLNLF